MENNNSNLTSRKEIKVFEAFAGIGSQYMALKNIASSKNWKIKSVGIIEWFIPAIIAYNAIHYGSPKKTNQTFDLKNITLSLDSKTIASSKWITQNLEKSSLSQWLLASQNISNNLFDITNTKGIDIPDDIDIFTYSFPCQDISNQGKQKGFNKGSNTRSGLLWEIERIFNEMKKLNKVFPKYLILENVKAIINKKNISTFEKWLKKLEKFGYESKYYLLNAINFGSAQNRERVFAISVLKEHKNKVNFNFPNFANISQSAKKLKDIIKDDLPYEKSFSQYQLEEKKINKLNNIKKYEMKQYTNFHSENYVYDINYSGPTLTASGAMSRIKLYFGKNKIRIMNPKECFKYMGFSTRDYENVVKTKLISPRQQVYLCGNSICVELLEAIFKTLEF